MTKIPARASLPLPEAAGLANQREVPPLEISFSEMANWVDCGYAYRLSSVLGFQQWLAEELGYGKAVHHVLRTLAELARTRGTIPGKDEIRALVEREFYTPFATAASHSQLFKSALRLVETYVTDYGDDLQRVWELERQFELHTSDGLLSGRADVILDNEGGEKQGLAILDYKVSKGEERKERNELQLRIYSHAGRQEGFNVRGAYLHSLAKSTREPVSIDRSIVADSVTKAVQALAAIRAGQFPAASSRKVCSACDHARLCRHCEMSVRADLEEWPQGQ
jgi:DNA helicase-2/ATP-dependent DNA helicase PcrA